jgi:hypothetical protein
MLGMQCVLRHALALSGLRNAAACMYQRLCGAANHATHACSRLSSLFARREQPAGGAIMRQAERQEDGTAQLPAHELGFSGRILRCSGRACPNLFHAPAANRVGADISGNVVRSR